MKPISTIITCQGLISSALAQTCLFLCDIDQSPDDSIVGALTDDDLKAAGLQVGMVCGFQ